MMIEKKAKTSVEINDLIASRWSGRAYNPDKSVSRKDILSLLEAARWAPSCFGDQPWRYIVFDRNSEKSDWHKAFSCLSEGNQSWAVNAPVLILSIADSVMSRNNMPNRWAQYDTGAASYSLCLQAVDRGLMVHQMGGFDVDKARDLFKVPEQFTPMAIMAVGYQLPLGKLDDEIRERELSERQRHPIDHNFFEGCWNKPFQSE